MENLKNEIKFRYIEIINPIKILFRKIPKAKRWKSENLHFIIEFERDIEDPYRATCTFHFPFFLVLRDRFFFSSNYF